MEHINKLLEEHQFTDVEKQFINEVRKEELPSAQVQQQVISSLIQTKALQKLSSQLNHSVGNLIINLDTNGRAVARSLRDIGEVSNSLTQKIDGLRGSIDNFSNETTNLTEKANGLLKWYVLATILNVILVAISLYIQISK